MYLFHCNISVVVIKTFGMPAERFLPNIHHSTCQIQNDFVFDTFPSAIAHLLFTALSKSGLKYEVSAMCHKLLHHLLHGTKMPNTKCTVWGTCCTG